MSFEQTVSFNGVDLSPWLLVTDVGRSIAPVLDVQRTEVPGMDGCLVSSARLSPLEVTVTACITRRAMADVSEARRAVAAALSSREPAPLRLPDEEGTYLMAMYEGGARPERLMQCPDVELTFLCPDPVAYGQPRSEEVAGTRRIEAGGTYKAFPTVRCRPPKDSSWQVTNVGTGEYVRVWADFTGSQEVVLDMGTERCTVDGADWPVDVSSDFFAIEGTAELRVSGGTATFEWNERWL